MERFDLLKKNVMKLTCGDTVGTAFLFADDMAITCRHCVENYFSENQNISLYAYNLDSKKEVCITARVIDEKVKSPIVVLKMDKAVTSMKHLELACLKGRPARDQKMYAYGYPESMGDAGFLMEFSFAEDNIGVKTNDADWRLQPCSKLTEYKGASGSPLVLSQKVIGILLTENSDGEQAFLVNAISSGSVRNYFSEHRISFEELDYDLYKHQENQYSQTIGTLNSENGLEIKFGSDNVSAVIKSGIQKELFDEIDQIYREKLEEIGEMRLEGKEKEAWSILRKTITRIQAGTVCSKKVVARFYYYQAICYLEDKEDGNNAQKYFQKAVAADPEIDTRTYIARKRLLEGTCSNVLDILLPLDSTSLLNTYLQLCVHMQECDKAIKAFEEATVAYDYNTYYMMALNYTMKHQLAMAEQMINRALQERKNIPLYLMMKGVIQYWKSIPLDLVGEYDLLPIVFESDILHLSKDGVENIEKTIECYQQALEITKVSDNTELQKLILRVWLNTLSVTDQMADESAKLIEQLEKIDKYDAGMLVWKCRNGYSVEEYQYIELENRIRDASAKIELVVALAELCLRREDKENARKYLLNYKYEFNRLGKLEWWYDLRIRSAVDIEDLNVVSTSLATSSMDDEYKQRFVGVILQKKNCEKELFAHAQDMYLKYGKRLDLINLVRVCDKYERWKDLEEYATIWNKNYGDETAQQYIAKAQLEQHKVEECIKKIEAFEKKGEISAELQYYKVQALKLNYRYDEAIKEGIKLWDKSKRESTLLVLSECYFLDGQGNEAITCLKQGIKNGIATSGVYQRLAENLSVINPREVKKYVRKACIAGNESPEIMAWGIQLLFQVGESAEATELLNIYQMKDFQTEKQPLRACTVKEALQIIENGRKRQGKINEMFFSCKIPYHMLIDSQHNASFAWLFWRNWEKDSFSYMMYGGRGWQEEKIISHDKKGIVMDYSSCVLLYELRLLRDTVDAFEQVWIDGNIFKLIASEKCKTRMHQPDMVVKHQRVLQICKNINIVMHEMPDEASIASYQKYGLQLLDAVNYRESEKYRLIWVEDLLGTELLEGAAKVPKEVRRAAIKPLEFLTFLNRRGMLSQEILEQYTKKDEEIREDIISGMLQAVGEKIKVLVDFSFLEVLYDLDCLEHIAEICELHAFSFAFNNVKEEGENLELTQRINSNLDGLEEELKEFKEDKKIQFIPYVELDDSVTVGIHTYQLKELMHYIAKEGISLVCDDRMVSSYDRAGGGEIFTSVDVINYLYDKGYITKESFMRTMKQLFDKNICYVLPSCEFMKNALLLSAEEGENSYLVSVRRYLQRILNLDSHIMKTSVEHQLLPEGLAYMHHLQNSCMHLLKWVWEQEREESWKKKTSQWLLYHFSEFGYAFSFGEGRDDKLVEYQAVRVAEFIQKGVFEVVDRNNRKQYFEWLFEWVGSYLAVNSGMEERIIKSFSTFFYTFLEENEKNDKRIKAVTLKMLADAINAMPEDLRITVLKDSYISGMLAHSKKETIVLDETVSIDMEEFMKWIGTAVDAGLRQPVLKKWEGNEYKIVFREDKPWNQRFWIYWENDRKYIEFSDPNVYLYSHWSKNRVKALKRIEKYLTKDEFKRYRAVLEKSRNGEVIEEIVKCLEMKDSYWRDKLRYIFSRENCGLFRINDIFPKYVEMFETSLPVYTESEWLNKVKILCEKRSCFALLDMLVKLPLGGLNSFAEVADALVGDDQLDEALNWCNAKRKKSHNPVELFNILAFLKRKGQEDDAEETLFRLLTEETSELKLYIELLRMVYGQMEIQTEYDKVKLEDKYLYGYLFTGILQDIFYELDGQNDLYGTVDDYICWAMKTNDVVYVNPREIIGNPEEDICSPVQVTGISLTFIAGCNFLLKEQFVIQNKDKLKALIDNLLEGEWTDSKNFVESLISDERRSNIFNTMNVGNLYKLCDEVMKMYNIGNVRQRAFLEPDESLKDIASKPDLDINELAYIYILSNDRIHAEWIPDMEQIVQNFHITQSEKEMGGKFKCIASVLKQCPQDFREVQIERFEQELRERFAINTEESFEDNFMMLEKLCVLKNSKEPFLVCLEFLEDITKEQPLNVTRQFADMYIGLMFRVKMNVWKRAQLLIYQFRW